MNQDLNDLPIVRIDFTTTDREVIINKLARVVDKDRFGQIEKHEHPREIVVETKHHPQPYDLDICLEWCRRNGWTVHTWPGGARAWKGEARPVRSARQIQKLRANLREHPQSGIYTNGLDLAYDY